MQKTLWLFGLALMLGLAGCGGGGGGGGGPAAAASAPSDALDAATAELGSALVPPPLHPALESELIPDAAASAADGFPAELKPPVG